MRLIFFSSFKHLFIIILGLKLYSFIFYLNLFNGDWPLVKAIVLYCGVPPIFQLYSEYPIKSAMLKKRPT